MQYSIFLVIIILLDKTGGGGTIREYGGGFLQSSTKATCSGRISSVPPDAVRLFVICHLLFFVVCRSLENALRFWRVPRTGPSGVGRRRPACKAVEDTIPKGCLPERDPEGRQDRGDHFAVVQPAQHERSRMRMMRAIARMTARALSPWSLLDVPHSLTTY